MRIPVDSDSAGSEERCSTHAGLEFHGEHLVDSWVASDQVRALSAGEAELYGIVDGSRNLHRAHVRGDGTNHQHRRRNGLDSCDRDVFPNRRWKDQTHSSSLVMDPRRFSRQGPAFERGDRHRQRGRHGIQRPRRTDTSELIAESAAQANPVLTALGHDRDSKRRGRRGSADEWQ